MSSSKRAAWQTGIAAVLIWMLVSPLARTAEVPSSAPTRSTAEAKLRGPVAIALADDGKMLLVANRRTGSVSLVDPKSAQAVAEVPIGKSLSDLVALKGPGAGLFLASDWASHQLHLLSYRDRSLKVVDSLAVAPFPATICVDAGGKQCFVASQWSRQLTVVDVQHKSDGSLKLKLKETIPLTFPPRQQSLSPDGTLLVAADAFGGRLAVVDASRHKIQNVQVIPGHNIRGLAWSVDGRRLLVVHQTLNRLAYSTVEDIHWGSVVSNVVRSLDRDALVSGAMDVLEHSRLYQLGDVGNGAGDPSSLAIAKDGTAFLALGGVDEVAGGHLEKAEMHRVHVGTRPTALALSGDGTELYAADTFGDAIDVIKTKDLLASSDKSIRRIPLGPQPALSAADRGERLFYDARLSNENWMSCNSCHSDGHSPDQLSDTLGDSSFGAPKRIPALGGVAETGPWVWNGSMHDLGEQVQKSVKTTMHAKAISPEQVRDLTEYLKTLKPAPPIGVPTGSSQQAAVEKGRVVFKRHGCDRCHVPPAYTSPKTYDVGLKDEMGNHDFNPPSLRGVGQRTALLHDGRAGSLAEVFQIHRHPANRELPTDEVADLIAFLRTL
jgi:DNA-binding beta-propeller fold protein YncE